MKILNLVFFVIFISLGTINLTVPEISKKHVKPEINRFNISEAGSVVEDVNNDGVVDSDDIAISIVESASFCESNCLADVNGDGFTNVTDTSIIYNYICEHLNQ